MKSKLFSVFLTLCLVFSLSFVSLPVNAQEKNEDSEVVEFTEELAIQTADSFAQGICPDKQLRATNPIKFYNNDNQAIGYIVSFYEDETPYGYVIFDVTSTDLISEYSITENAQSPYETAVQRNSKLSRSASSGGKAYKLDPITYGYVPTDNEYVYTNSGEQIEADKVIDNYNLESRSVTPGTWDVIFIPISSLYEDYKIVDTNYTDLYCSFTESYVTSMTKHYACVVSAMANCADYYGVMSIPAFSNDYMRLWNLSGTTVLEQTNNITYGLTTFSNTGPAFTQFCSEKGLSVGYGHYSNPGYGIYKNFIDRGDVGIIHCGIVISESDGSVGRQGHSMAVQGYATLQKKGSGTNVETVMVADGWFEPVRYINLDYNWTDIAVTEFYLK